MTYTFTCPFSITASHEILTKGFHGRNSVELKLPFNLDSPFGIVGTALSINKISNNEYLFHVISATLEKEEQQVSFLELIASYISLRIGVEEVNPHYGTLFVKPKWHQLESIGDAPARSMLSASLSLKSILTLDISAEKFLPSAHSDLLNFYYDGLRAEHLKSKYFHFFLVLEYLEISQKYKTLFDKHKLFDTSEAKLIETLANKMPPPKKGALLNVLSRTKDSRESKLLAIIHGLGITSITTLGQNKNVDLAMIKSITKNRNKLFHSGAAFPAEALWRELFQLATLVVAHISRNPTCLDT